METAEDFAMPTIVTTRNFAGSIKNDSAIQECYCLFDELPKKYLQWHVKTYPTNS